MNRSAKWPAVASPPLLKQRGTRRIPDLICSDAQLYDREIDTLFCSGHWCYVALECEIPITGDFTATMIGARTCRGRECSGQPLRAYGREVLSE